MLSFESLTMLRFQGAPGCKGVWGLGFRVEGSGFRVLMKASRFMISWVLLGLLTSSEAFVGRPNAEFK